jgi:hypothetical protein
MPLDHYISQVHLKKFNSPALGDRMHAVRKSDLKAFTPNSRVVCVVNDGSTNAYLLEDRAIENFLETIEPKYNSALEKLADQKIDQECIYTIAGFVAYVISCSPAGMRIHSEPLKSTVETTAAMMDAAGLLPPPPPELAGVSLTQLLQQGAVQVKIDTKYPQAMGISSILERTATFGNFRWEILLNDFGDSPFFTSDFPAAIEKTGDPRILNRIVPLAPNLALRIRPNLSLERGQADFSFRNFGFRTRRVSRQEVMNLNCLIVRCAEDMVFYRDDHPWILPFIAKNRHYRIEPHTHELRTAEGTLLISTLRVIARSATVAN